MKASRRQTKHCRSEAYAAAKFPGADPIFWAKFKRVAGFEFFPRAAAVVAERVPRRRAVGRYMQQYFDTQNNTKIQIQLQTHM